MVTVNSITEYRQVQQRRISKLKSLKRRGPITAAKFMAANCRRLAPKYTGNVIRSIVRRGNKVSVGGSNPINGFPYIHWINSTPGSGLEAVAYKSRFGDPKRYTFAQAARNKSTVGFFWTAENRTRKFYRESMIRNTRNILQTRF